jgi:serine/threonine-protein kinase
VAVKVLLPELAASLGHERFLREIQVTAKLSHPHILPLYDSGEAEGFLYYVMPFVEGETLGDLIAREKQLPIPDAVRITREVAEALGHAHAYGLVHRDIKPANVMLSGGHAVVADFGIALAVTEAGGEKLTQTGTAIGTALYMSPEQSMGLEDIDGRSDIYSLGCMLYEMLVGQVPFTGPNPQAIMARHTMDAVSPPSIIRQTITPELEDIIFSALAKAPADRFRTAGEFAEALSMLDSGTLAQQRHSRAATMARTAHTEALDRTGRGRRLPRKAIAAVSAVAAVGIGFGVWQLWPGGGSGSTAGGLDPANVAVLYFDDLSSNGELGHVVDGLTEGLIDQLAQVRGLDVVSRNGVAQYRDTDLARDSIARALAAGSLVLGSVEPAGDRLRVTTRLVDGESGVDLERASFELPATDLLAARDSIVESTSRFLRQRLGEEVRIRERRAGTASVEAWTLVQRAERTRKEGEEVRSEDRDRAFDAYQQADSLLRLAEAADPDWPEPAVQRARTAYTMSRLYDRDPQQAGEWIEIGLGIVERAFELSPNNAEAQEVRGTLRYFKWLHRLVDDPDDAERLFESARQDLESAVQIDPQLAGAYSLLSHLYSQTGDLMSVAIAAQRAYQEDAYLRNADVIIYRLFTVSYDLEQHSQASRWCTEGRRRFPDDYRFARCQLVLMTMPEAEADVALAWQTVAEWGELSPDHLAEYHGHLARMYMGGVLARAGLADSARRVLEAARADREVDPRRDLAWTEAYMRVLLGDHDEAIDLLTQYMAANPDQIHGEESEADVYWWWKDLRDDPRFRRVVMGR